jgi:hypothetical protein
MPSVNPAVPERPQSAFLKPRKRLSAPPRRRASLPPLRHLCGGDRQLSADYGPSDLHPGTGRFDPDLTHGAGTKRQVSSTSSAWSRPVRRNANTQAACASRERRFWRHSAPPFPPNRAPPGSRNLCSILSSAPARPVLLSIISGAPEDLTGGRPNARTAP